VNEFITGAGSSTVIFFKMTSWGASGLNLPADGASCQLEVKGVFGNDASAPAIPLTWYTGAGNDPGIGEFYFFHAGAPLDTDVFICKVPGITLSLGTAYAMRFNDGVTWSTINLPSDLLNGHFDDLGEPLLTLPKMYGRNNSPPHLLQIFYSEPTVHRDGRYVLDDVNGTVTPMDLAAYNDILKDPSSSYRFPVSLRLSGSPPAYVAYPVIVIKETSNPNDITGPNDPGAVPGITIPLAGGRESGRINVDITALILNLPPPIPGDTHYFSYKLFDALDGEVGWGKFDVPSEPVDPVLPEGVAWGVNVGDRGDWNKLDFNLLATNAMVDGGTMKTPTPDVLWVRFNGGARVLDWDEYWSGGTNNNVQLVFDNVANGDQQSVPLSVVCIGVTVNNDCLAIHHLNRYDGTSYTDWAASPPNGGVLNPGDTYNLGLDDPSTGGVDYWFPTQMDVAGTNPNY
jgi:hypothetical protein